METLLQFLKPNKKRHFLLAQRNGTRRTNISASAALRASVCVDYILFAFRNSTYRTLVDASAASYTIITNYVSHIN